MQFVPQVPVQASTFCVQHTLHACCVLPTPHAPLHASSSRWSELGLPCCFNLCCMQQILSDTICPACSKMPPQWAPWTRPLAHLLCCSAMAWESSLSATASPLASHHPAQHRWAAHCFRCYACPCISHYSTGRRADLSCSCVLQTWLLLRCWHDQMRTTRCVLSKQPGRGALSKQLQSFCSVKPLSAASAWIIGSTRS